MNVAYSRLRVDHAHPATTEFLDDAIVRDGLAEHLQECYGVQIGMSMHGLAGARRRYFLQEGEIVDFPPPAGQ
jgi:hypothetical protein